MTHGMEAVTAPVVDPSVTAAAIDPSSQRANFRTRVRGAIGTVVAFGALALAAAGCFGGNGLSADEEARLASSSQASTTELVTTTTESKVDVEVCPDGMFPNGPWEASDSAKTDTPDALHWSPARGDKLDSHDKLMRFFFSTDQTACRSAATLGTLQYLGAYLNGFGDLTERHLDTSVSLQDMVDHLTKADKKVQERAADYTAEMLSTAELNKEPLNGRWVRFVKKEARDEQGNITGMTVMTQPIDLAGLGGIPEGTVWLMTGAIKDDSGDTGGINHQIAITQSGEILATESVSPQTLEATTTTSTTTTTAPAGHKPNKHGTRPKRSGNTPSGSRTSTDTVPANNGTTGPGNGTGTGSPSGSGPGGPGTGPTGPGTPGGGETTPPTTAAPHKGSEVTIPGSPN